MGSLNEAEATLRSAHSGLKCITGSLDKCHYHSADMQIGAELVFDLGSTVATYWDWLYSPSAPWGATCQFFPDYERVRCVAEPVLSAALWNAIHIHSMLRFDIHTGTKYDSTLFCFGRRTRRKFDLQGRNWGGTSAWKKWLRWIWFPTSAANARQ